MKSVKFIPMVIAFAGLLFSLTPPAWAGGAGGELGCCVVTNPGGGALAIKGTMAVVYTWPAESELANLDVKLRLERGGKFGFFQLNLKQNIYGLDNFEITCLVLNPYEPKPTEQGNSIEAVKALVNQILGTFFPGSGRDCTNTRLVITRSSVTNTDGSAGGPIQTIPGDETTNTDRIAAMGDIMIYAVDPEDAKVEQNCNCPLPLPYPPTP